jgi:hypothetical protein
LYEAQGLALRNGEVQDEESSVRTSVSVSYHPLGVRAMISQVRGARFLMPALSLLFLALSLAAAQDATRKAEKAPPRPPVTLRVDPLLIAEAGEVWSLIASPNNPIWPGWDASSTPLLFYLPGEQDVLINHPHPPEGFLPYDGPVQFPGGHILLRNGPTIVAWDGQNTSNDVQGVRTLIVADSLSNLRARISTLVQDPRPADEKVQNLHFSDLATDPYDQLALVVHEAFHVFQDKQAPDKGANEMALATYPVLSVQNNVGFALEGAALAEALHATDNAAFRRAALRWLAVRKDRRSHLPQETAEYAEYEDGTEFNEGLAKYTEYRLFQVLEGMRPGPAISLAQGFAGYADLAPQRERLIEALVRNMSGAVVVNNDPYGAAPLRMRLYYSGMALGVMLDKLSPTWKSRIFSPDVSLTSLAEEALKPSQAELDQALTVARSEPSYASLVESKTKLAKEGKAQAEAVLKEIEGGAGISLVLDYSQLGSINLGLAFTPFGITAVDADRMVFTQVPIKVVFGKEGDLAQTTPAPLLRDTARRLVRFRLPRSATKAEVEKALDAARVSSGPVANLALDLPGATLKAAKAQVRWSGEDLVVVLLKGSEEK